MQDSMMSNTAKEALELVERLHAYDSSDALSAEVLARSWVGTLVGVAGVSLLIGAGEIEEVIETPPVTSVPGTKPWVLGVAAFTVRLPCRGGGSMRELEGLAVEWR